MATKMESSHSVAFTIKCLWEKNLWNFPGGPVVICLIQRLYKDFEEFEEEHIGRAVETKRNI